MSLNSLFTAPLTPEQAIERLQQLSPQEQDELYRSFVFALLLSERSNNAAAASQAREHARLFKAACNMSKDRCGGIVQQAMSDIEQITAALDAILTKIRAA